MDKNGWADMTADDYDDRDDAKYLQHIGMVRVLILLDSSNKWQSKSVRVDKSPFPVWTEVRQVSSPSDNLSLLVRRVKKTTAFPRRVWIL